jgi:hypothetical protein
MSMITEERAPVVPRQSFGPRVDRIVLVVGAVVAAVAVPSLSMSPTATWDDSWRVGLTLSASHHVQWGQHLAFTYGPLGYLIQSTVVSARLAYAALAFQVLVRIALYLSLAFGLRRRIPFVWACVVSLVAVEWLSTPRIFSPITGSIPLALGVVWCYFLVLDDLGRRWVTALSVSLGALSALLFFIQPTPASLLLATSLVAGALGPRRPVSSVAACLAGFGAGLVVFSVAAHQSLTNLPILTRTYAQIVAGYSAAMSVPGSRRDVPLAILAVAVVVLSLVRLLRGVPKKRQVGAGLITALFLFDYFKEGFVRQDHAVTFFAMCFLVVVGTWAAQPVSATAGRSDPSVVGRARPLPWRGVPALALTGLCLLAVVDGSPSAIASSGGRGLQRTASSLRHLYSPRAAQAEIRAARSGLRAEVPLPPPVLDALREKSVFVEPLDEDLAWAYGLAWAPPLVPQAYVAYTADLDRRAADLLSSQGPDRILWTGGPERARAVDDRLWSFDPPDLQTATTCHYRQIEATAAFQVLARVANRCTAPRLIGTVHTRLGQPVAVPAVQSGQMVIATFKLPTSLQERIADLLFKPPSTYIVTDDGQRYRFIAATAGDQHIMRPPTSIGTDPDWTAKTINSFRINVPHASGPVAVSFYAVTVT